MDNSWQSNPTKIHYHLARASKHLNYSILLGFFPSLSHPSTGMTLMSNADSKPRHSSFPQHTPWPQSSCTIAIDATPVHHDHSWGHSHSRDPESWTEPSTHTGEGIQRSLQTSQFSFHSDWKPPPQRIILQTAQHLRGIPRIPHQPWWHQPQILKLVPKKKSSCWGLTKTSWSHRGPPNHYWRRTGHWPTYLRRGRWLRHCPSRGALHQQQPQSLIRMHQWPFSWTGSRAGHSNGHDQPWSSAVEWNRWQWSHGLQDGVSILPVVEDHRTEDASHSRIL